MLYRRIASALIILAVAFLGIGIIVQGIKGGSGIVSSVQEQLLTGKIPQTVEEFSRTHFPWREKFRNLAIEMRLWGGQTQQKDIFIGEDILLENIQPPDRDYVEKNMRNMLDFAQDSVVPVYAMIIPCKCAIKQQQIPQAKYVQMFNEKEFLEGIYNGFSGRISVVDAYSPLFSNQEQYIYYRTDPNLTALGAYYVYGALASRLNVRPLDISEFSIQHNVHQFYGETYQQMPYGGVSPDIVSLYHLRDDEVQYSVRHNNGKMPYTYPSLYPQWKSQIGSPLDVYLGGNTGDIEIRTYNSGKGNRRLLIFGDDTMMPVLPFLASSFDEIRFVDLSKLDESEIFAIDVFYYDQVVFAYSLDTFAHTDNPSRIMFS